MSDSIFVGRKNELSSLKALLLKKSASLVVIKGRRRIGKSGLVEEFAKGKKFFAFSGIPPAEGISAQSQRNVFAQQLGAQIGISSLQCQDWADLFTLLSRYTSQGPVVILFDEISWMGSKDPAFLGKLKNAWDLEFQKNPNLILILCGSVSTWINKNIISSTAFFGRISLYVTLEELPLDDCNALLNLQGFRGSVYEKFKILSILGGIPWYLQQVRSNLTADENIKNLCFRKDGTLFNEFNRIFNDLFEKRSGIYRPIVEILANGPKEYKEISEELKYPKSGVLSSYLEDLVQSGFITRDYTWSIRTGKPSRLSHFRLSDNYLRFYLKFVMPHVVKIQQDYFKDVTMEALPGWRTILGLQFENLVLKNRRKIWKKLRIRGENIVLDNPFFQRKTVSSLGCQIDYLIQTQFNTLFACEIKSSSTEIKSDVILEMKNKLGRLTLPKGFSVWPVLICVSGISESVADQNYFVEVIDFSQFLEGD